MRISVSLHLTSSVRPSTVRRFAVSSGPIHGSKETAKTGAVHVAAVLDGNTCGAAREHFCLKSQNELPTHNVQRPILNRISRRTRSLSERSRLGVGSWTLSVRCFEPRPETTAKERQRQQQRNNKGNGEDMGRMPMPHAGETPATHAGRMPASHQRSPLGRWLSCSAVKTGPSLQTYIGPTLQRPHLPTPHFMRFSSVV